MFSKSSAFLLKVEINLKIRHYGKMTHLEIDTEARRLIVTADLLGEPNPVEAAIHYQVEEEPAGMLFASLEIGTSREWLTLLSQEILKMNKIRLSIPAGIATTMVRALKLWGNSFAG